VHVAQPTPTVGTANCTVPDNTYFCQSPNLGLAAGSVIHTVSDTCNVAHGSHTEASVFYSLLEQVMVPLSLQGVFTSGDGYAGTLTNVDIPGGGTNFLYVNEDYTASSGNGASCVMTYTYTTS
jgi:hypothetical protein